jgi:phosphoribosylglycinamide formyltransferase 1
MKPRTPDARTLDARTPDAPAHLAVFASGRGSNLAALLEAFPPHSPEARVALVVSDKKGAPALDIAAAAGARALHVPFASRDAFEERARALLAEHRIDLLCLAGFMRILSPAFVAAYEGRILNVHPSLLPAFPGLRAQRQALRAGALESGCTVHFVDACVDSGPIVLQRAVPVLPDDTEASLAARILAEEHVAYPEAVRRVLASLNALSEVPA